MGLAVGSESIGTAVDWIKRNHLDASPSAIWQQGLQVEETHLVNTKWLFQGGSKGLVLLSEILFANGYQLMVSFLYIFYNNIITRQLVAAEWIRFLKPEGKKPLRVSSPVGMQRSSYMLSLPMSYSVPLMLAFMLLHWLISQSVFIIQTTALAPGPDTYRLPNYDSSAVGYSVLGTILSTATGAVLVLGLIVNAVVRKFKDVPSEFLAMGTNSAAISAVCHPPPDDKDTRLFPLNMGVISTDGSEKTTPRLTFSTFVDIQEPEDGEEYLQPVMTNRGPGRCSQLIRRMQPIAISSQRSLAKQLKWQWLRLWRTGVAIRNKLRGR